MPNVQQLAARLDALEKQVKDGQQKGLLEATVVTQTNLLNQLIKAYDKNIKIVGYKYDIKDSRTYNKKTYEAWCIRVINDTLVATKVVNEDDVFVKVNGERTLIRGIISNFHPLTGQNNAAIVVAFNEASFAQQIKETVRQNRGINLGDIRIHVHLPPILDALHNEALRSRAATLDAARKAGAPRKIHCKISLSPPWISLVEVDSVGFKKSIPFKVEDGRLVDPAETMAKIALKKGKFRPYKFLSDQEKRDIPKDVLTKVSDAAVPMEGVN